MADNAPMIQYRSEFIHGFEVRQSLLRDAVTTEAMISGNQATFLVADSGGATTTTRGVNGLIPARADNNQQYTATLTEQHDLVRKTGFNVFESQGDQRRIMQETTMAVVNRRIDQDIIDVLDTATNQAGASAVTATLALCTRAKTILGVNEVPFDGNIWALITPAFEGYLLDDVAQFSSADYVTKRPMEGGTAWMDSPGFYNWLGVKWIVHPNLTGVGTSSESCFMFHKSAIGHAIDTGGMSMAAGYDDEQDYSYARCSVYLGSTMLQQSGVVEMLHNGIGKVAT